MWIKLGSVEEGITCPQRYCEKVEKKNWEWVQSNEHLLYVDR